MCCSPNRVPRPLSSLPPPLPPSRSGAAVGGVLAERSFPECLIFLGVAILVFMPINFMVVEELEPLPYLPNR